MRLYRIDYPKILWGIVLLSLPFAMPRAAEAEPTRKETARQVGLALSQADAQPRQEAVNRWQPILNCRALRPGKRPW